MPPAPRARGSSGGGAAGGTLAMRPQQQAAAASGPAPPPPPPQQQQPEMYNAANWKNNFGVVYFLRIYMTIVAGVVAGVLGITGVQGFVGYLVSQVMVVPLILLKAGGNTKKYFPSWDKVVLEHVFSSTAILSYFLCWMLAYNLGHVF